MLEAMRIGIQLIPGAYLEVEMWRVYKCFLHAVPNDLMIDLPQCWWAIITEFGDIVLLNQSLSDKWATKTRPALVSTRPRLGTPGTDLLGSPATASTSNVQWDMSARICYVGEHWTLNMYRALRHVMFMTGKRQVNFKTDGWRLHFCGKLWASLNMAAAMIWW